MTDVIARIGRRAPEAPASPALPAGHLPTLADLPVGAGAQIVGFVDGPEAGTARRLHDLGFEPGAHVQALRRAPFGDPVVFQVADYEIALRSTQTRTIRIALT